MRSKGVILVTALFIAILFSSNASSQVLLGDHSPSLSYNPLARMYRSVHLAYGFPLLAGAEIDLWGTVYGGFPFITGGVDDHSSPAIAFDNVNDRYLLVWTRAWPYLDLYGLLTDYSSVIRDQFLISSVPGVRTKPMVTYNSVLGGYLVTWLDERNIEGVAIYGQLISVEGELQGAEFMIASGLSREDSEPSHSVAYDHVNQRFLVVWMPGESIHGQLINSNGTFYGEKFTIVENDPDGYYPIGQTSLAYDGLNQRYLVVWDLPYSTGLTYGQLVSAHGTLEGTVFSISEGYSRYPSVAFDNVNQRFLVAWTWVTTDGQFVNPDGTLQGDRLSISPKSSWTHDNPPAIAFNPECGNFLVASVARESAEALKNYVWGGLQSNINFTVVGNPCPAATLTVKMKGYGGKHRSITGTGINCKKKACTGQYLPGSEVSINAWVDGGYGNGIAVSWTGCDTVVGNDCHITMDSDKNVTAKFARAPRRER
jgi:hypothetical protein